RPREPFRRSRLPELFSTCPVRGEARLCPAPSGRHASDRRPAATSLPRSRRIWRISLSAEVGPLPAAYKAAAQLLSATSRYSFLTSSFSPQSPTALLCPEEPWCFRHLFNGVPGVPARLDGRDARPSTIKTYPTT